MFVTLEFFEAEQQQKDAQHISFQGLRGMNWNGPGKSP